MVTCALTNEKDGVFTLRNVEISCGDEVLILLHPKDAICLAVEIEKFSPRHKCFKAKPSDENNGNWYKLSSIVDVLGGGRGDGKEI